MKATYKFFKYKAGISSFAVVGLETVSSSETGVVWSTKLVEYERTYSDAVAEGVAAAMKHHITRGGAPSSFIVTEFTELIVDTKEDAVCCAATVAAWKALGHDESEIVFEFDGHKGADISPQVLEKKHTNNGPLIPSGGSSSAACR